MITIVCRNCGKSCKASCSKKIFCSKDCNKSYRLSHADEKFWDKVDRRGDDECWEFKGFITHDGYGSVRVTNPDTGKSYNDRSNRVAYWLATGEYPGENFVCHKCDNRKCCNPKHLWLGTNTDNVRDMHSKGRANRKSGAENKLSKLTPDMVKDIHIMHEAGWSYAQLSERHDISMGTVWRAFHHPSWKHIA